MGDVRAGDICVFRTRVDAAIEWLCVREHPDDPGLMLVVPVDDFSLSGTQDTHVSDDAGGRDLTARCGESAWVARGIFSAPLRIGSSSAESLAAVRQALAALARGEIPDAQVRPEIDADPEYEWWMGLVRRAVAGLSHD
jgi:hypothetical protein